MIIYNQLKTRKIWRILLFVLVIVILVNNLSYFRNPNTSQGQSSKDTPGLIVKRVFTKEKLGRIIFCINSGRSGSGYLFSLLHTAENVSSHHEDNPKMCCKHMRLIARAGYPESYEYRANAKIDYMRSRLKPGQIYFDSSHLFIKTFYDVVIDAFGDDYEIDVILLRRYLPDIINSYERLDSFKYKRSQKYYLHQNWYHSLNSKVAILPPLAKDQDLTPMERSIAYALDIEAKAQWFMKQYPDIKVHEVRLEELQNIEGVLHLFEALRLNPKDIDKTKQIIGKVVNDKGSKLPGAGKNKKMIIEEIEKYIAKCHVKGISIPHLPHMEEIEYHHLLNLNSEEDAYDLDDISSIGPIESDE